MAFSDWIDTDTLRRTVLFTEKVGGKKDQVTTCLEMSFNGDHDKNRTLSLTNQICSNIILPCPLTCSIHYNVCRCLPDADDRVFSTIVDCNWTYKSLNGLNFCQAFNEVRFFTTNFFRENVDSPNYVWPQDL